MQLSLICLLFFYYVLIKGKSLAIIISIAEEEAES